MNEKVSSEEGAFASLAFYSGLNLNQDKATKPQTVQIVPQGEATPYWFKVNPLYFSTTNLNLLHFKQLTHPSKYKSRRSYQKGRLKPLRRSFRRPLKFQTDKKSVFHQHRAPSEAAAYAFEQQVLSALDLTVLNTDIERERDGSGGCVAVFLYGQDDFFHVQTQVFGS